MGKLTVYNVDDDSYSKVEEPDPSVSYTYADYLKWRFEERLELFRGKIFKLSAPNTLHQKVSRNISGELYLYLKNNKCQSFVAPFDVRLPAKNRKKDNEVTTVVQPDICVICDPSILDKRGCCGAPDLVVEILSPGNFNHDLIRKKELYEKFGVTEYWVVTPETKETVGFFLKDGKYRESGHYVGKIHSVILDNAEFEF